MNHWNSQRYLKDGRAKSKSLDLLNSAIATAEITRAANPNVPPILTLNHLAYQVGVPYDLLRSVVARGGESGQTFYRVYKVKKNDAGHARGRTRTICVPSPLLLKTQRWIHENILIQGRFHEAACAYRPKAKIFDAASVHCEARWMVKMDVTNFFESILEPKVYRVFRAFGYQPLVALELTRLCTRLRNSSPIRSFAAPMRIDAYNSGRLGHLPQGAPTSPLLANLASYVLDLELTEIAVAHEMSYTRYADDITFSTSSLGWSRKKAVDLLEAGHIRLRAHGFSPNHAKAHIVAPGARKIVLGLAVDREVPRLTKQFKNKLRAHIYYLQRYQLSNSPPHQLLGFDSVLGFQRHVFGLAYYAMGIEREWGAARLAELKAVGWPTSDGIAFD